MHIIKGFLKFISLVLSLSLLSAEAAPRKENTATCLAGDHNGIYC